MEVGSLSSAPQLLAYTTVIMSLANGRFAHESSLPQTNG
jgi:hypothetical protein